MGELSVGTAGEWGLHVWLANECWVCVWVFVLAVLEWVNNGIPGTAFLKDRLHFISSPVLGLSARSHACSRPGCTLHSPYTQQVNERQNPGV